MQSCTQLAEFHPHTHSLAHKACYKRVQDTRFRKFQPIFSKPSFILSDSILDLVYFQLLLWLGFLFSPLLPAFMVAILVIMFYVKKFSVVWNLEPDNDAIFRHPRMMFLSLIFILIVYICAFLLVGYAVISLRPSSECGPFQNQSHMYSVLTLHTR